VTISPLELLAGLVIEDGRRWGDAAVPVQWEDARAAFDPDGPPYNYLTRARGYSKTQDLAGINVASMLAEAPAGSRLYGLAADRDQGRLLIDSVAGFVARTPELSGAISVDQFKASTNAGTQLEVLPADASGSYGLRPFRLLVDELAQWAATTGPRKLWEATTSAMAKIPGSRLTVLTSAGDPAHWSHKILEHAYGDPLWRVHEVAGPPPWADAERLAEQRRRLPESSYLRLFENRWTAAEDRLTSLEDLRACVLLDGPLEPVAGGRYVIGLDLGLKRDRTVAAVAHGEKAGDGVRVVLDRMEVWSGTRLRPVNLTAVEEWLLEVALRFNRAKIIADPYQAVGMAQRLRRGGLQVEEYAFSQQSVGRLAVALHTAIRDHRLVLPADEELIDELANVRLRETSPGVLRMDHDSDKHDDRAIALSLAVEHLATNGPGQGAAFLEVYRKANAAQAAAGPPVDPALRSLPTFADTGRAKPAERCQHRWQRWPEGQCCVLCAGWKEEVNDV
jgi:hypothetical protein